MNASPPLVFRIVSDWRGHFSWRLIDGEGRQISASRWSYAALSGAWRDALATRDSNAALEGATLDDRYA